MIQCGEGSPRGGLAVVENTLHCACMGIFDNSQPSPVFFDNRTTKMTVDLQEKIKKLVSEKENLTREEERLFSAYKRRSSYTAAAMSVTALCVGMLSFFYTISEVFSASLLSTAPLLLGVVVAVWSAILANMILMSSERSRNRQETQNSVYVSFATLLQRHIEMHAASIKSVSIEDIWRIYAAIQNTLDTDSRHKTQLLLWLSRFLAQDTQSSKECRDAYKSLVAIYDTMKDEHPFSSAPSPISATLEEIRLLSDACDEKKLIYSKLISLSNISAEKEKRIGILEGRSSLFTISTVILSVLSVFLGTVQIVALKSDGKNQNVDQIRQIEEVSKDLPSAKTPKIDE